MAFGAGDIAQAVVLNTKYDNTGTKALHKDLDETEAKGSKVGSALGAIGKGLAVAGGVGVAGAVVGLVGAVNKAADFEEALNGVAAAAGKLSQNEMKQLRESALQTGKDTALSATESIKAYGELVKAGVDVKDVVGGAGLAVVNLAISQNAAVEDMATLASSSLNTFQDTLKAFGSVSDQTVHVSDVLARTANASAIDIHDIGFSLQAVGPVAAQAGLSVDDFGAAIGLMGQHALRGSDAGTSLKTMLLSLTAPTNTAAAGMDSIGFSAFDAQGKVRPFRDILGELQQKTKDMSDQEKSGLYKQIFGTDAIRAANILIGEGADGWDAFNQKLREAPSVSEQAQKRMEGMRGALKQLGGSIETLQIDIGSVLLPALAKVATGATDVVNSIIEGNWGKAWRQVTSGFSDALRGGLNIAKDLSSWLGQMFELINWTDVLRGIKDLPGRIGDGFKGALDIADQLGTWLGDQLGRVDWKKVWLGIQIGGAELFGPSFFGFASGVEDTVTHIATVIQQDVVPAVQSFIDELTTNVVPAWLNRAQDAISWLGEHPDILAGAALGVGTLAAAWQVYNIAAGIAAAITGTILSPIVLITAAAAGLGIGITELVLHWQDLQGVYPPLKQFSDWFGNSFVPGLTTGFTTISTAIQSVVSWVQGHWAGISDLLSGPFQILFAIVQGQFNLIKDEIQLALDVITGIAKIFGDVFRGDWSQLWTDIKGLASNVFSDIGRLIGDQISAWVGIFGGVWTTIKAASSQAWTEIGDTVTGALHGIWQWAQDHWVDVIGTVLLGPLFLFRDQIPGVLDAAAGFVTGKLHDVWQWLQDNWVDVLGVALFGPFYLFRDQIGGVMRAAGNALLEPLRGVIGGLNDFLTGFVDAVNWVPQHLHLGDLIPGGWSLPQIPQLARGTDNWPGGMAWVGERGAELAYLPAGSAVLPHEESVRAALRMGLPIPGFQFGLGDIAAAVGGTVHGVLDKAGDFAGDALDFAKRLIAMGAERMLEEALSTFHVDLQLPGAFKEVGAAVFAELKDLALAAIKELVTGAGAHVPASFQGIAVNLPGTVTDWVHAGAQLGLGRDLTADELGAILYLISRESGGDPNAYNPVDVGNGEHAQGILQTIGSTFAAYAVPGHGNILNPVDNIAAALRYILAAYHGDLTAPARAEAGGAAGYGRGGVAGLHGPELAWLGEYGPERVTPLAEGVGELTRAGSYGTAMGTETQALGYYLAQQVTLLTSLQTLGLAQNANDLAILDALRGSVASSDRHSAAQTASTDATTAAVTATGANTAAAVEKVVTPGGLTNTPELTEFRKALSELVPLIAGGGGLAPAVKAATSAATAAAGGLGGLTDADEYAALRTRFLGDDLREASSVARDATSASGALADKLRDIHTTTADMGGEFVKAGKAVSGLADSAKGAAQQLDAVGTPGTAPNPYAPSTEAPKAPTASSYFGNYVLGITSLGGQVALYVKQSVPGQGSSIPTGRYNLRGFATGGVLTEPVAGIGLLSGRAYSFAENGPETFRPVSESSVQPAAALDRSSFGDVYVTIPVNDLEQIHGINAFFDRIQQEARAQTGAR